MKAILISIKPKWVASILRGEKTIEIRKTMPKCELPIDVYIYCTKGERKTTYDPHNFVYYELNGTVVAKFTLNKVNEIRKTQTDNWFIETQKGIVNAVVGSLPNILEKSCLKEEELINYIKGKKGYAWHISNLIIFDKPKELSEFYGAKQYFVGCESGIDKTPRYAQLTKAPQSWQWIETGE